MGKKTYPTMHMTTKQHRFTEEYMVSLNATQAALRAGYSPHTASQLGYQLLQIPSVQNGLQQLAEARSARTQIRADMVLERLWQIATADIGLIFGPDGRLRPTAEIPQDVRQSVASIVTVEAPAAVLIRSVRMPDRVRALELLGKHLRLFTGASGYDDAVMSLRERLARGRRRATAHRKLYVNKGG